MDKYVLLVNVCNHDKGLLFKTIFFQTSWLTSVGMLLDPSQSQLIYLNSPITYF